MKAATTDIPPVPDLATPEHELHIIESNGEFGESQDLLYDNIDQYTAFLLIWNFGLHLESKYLVVSMMPWG